MGKLEHEIKSSKFGSEFEKSIINLLYTSHYVENLHAELFKTHDITTPQFNVLRILRGQHPNPSTVNLIIERMIDKSSNASRILDKLQKKSLIDRVQSAKDKRAVDVLITASGLKLLRILDAELEQVRSKMCKLNEDEALQLNKLLDKFRC